MHLEVYHGWSLVALCKDPKNGSRLVTNGDTVASCVAHSGDTSSLAI